MKNIVQTATAVLLIWAATAIGSAAQDLTTVVSFDGTNGTSPVFGLAQGIDGDVYGTSEFGGTTNSGTIFKVAQNGTLTTLYESCSMTGCPDGEFPYAPVLLGRDGNSYGTTSGGGTATMPSGTVFKITPSGALTTLYDFCPTSGCLDGAFPLSPLVQGTDGNLYGTTYEGGTNNLGTLFRITTAGKYTRLYSFCSQTACSDGEHPSSTGLMQGSDGNFYGTAPGGANGAGIVFKITASGKLTTLYTFCSRANCSDGEYPGTLLQAANGNFYGVTAAGGSCSYSAQGCGTVFSLTAAGKLTTLYTFCPEVNCPDGANPSGLIQAADGNFYGTTSQGGKAPNGTSNGGAIFKITPAGKLTTLYSFCAQTNCTDGTIPASLVQTTDGSFWGLTLEHGTDSPGCPNACGTVFQLTEGLAPFAELLPTSGKVGGTIIILGNKLTGSTSVSFNGKAASFTVVSATEIKATVPTGATSGKVRVTTPGGVLTSNVTFRVTN